MTTNDLLNTPTITADNYASIIRDAIVESGSEILEIHEPKRWLGNPHLVFTVAPEMQALPRRKCVELIKTLARMGIDVTVDWDGMPGQPIRGFIVDVIRVNGERV